MIKLGCSLYSFSFIRLPSFNMFLEFCVNKMCEQGILYFELPIWDTFTVEDAINILALVKAKIQCYSVHLPKQFSAKDVLDRQDLLEGILKLKPSITVLHVQSIWDFSDEYIKLSELLRKYDCQLCVEFIAYKDMLKDFFSTLDNSVNITLDFYHCANAGFSVEKVIGSYSETIKHIHFNDYANSSQKALCPGEGILPLSRYIKLLKQQNYNGVYMLECDFNCKEKFLGMLNNLYSKVGI